MKKLIVTVICLYGGPGVGLTLMDGVRAVVPSSDFHIPVCRGRTHGEQSMQGGITATGKTMIT
ncbi:hypothetical protein ACFQ49_00685 [Kroppenstedtia eburnea]|uniref:Uncharacterized protein n=1 Tax=Kroppenstedtia eburnea TaxID=714067 RepID=A0A1N7IRP5_9BACL|nr:hypothetical protein [Kroppenstedtia eburnea]QKI82120.1 hypothetical protein GXN75_08945 [Kroppenstedtia eburnea]SIS39651.1 hypothetical protein SAMN05421790_101271 [Kroppenstedtia eburnea]